MICFEIKFMKQWIAKKSKPNTRQYREDVERNRSKVEIQVSIVKTWNEIEVK